jgi:hypothetical protein
MADDGLGDWDPDWDDGPSDGNEEPTQPGNGGGESGGTIGNASDSDDDLEPVTRVTAGASRREGGPGSPTWIKPVEE